MTFVLAVNGRDSIWLLADRRLSFERGPPQHDARKIMCIHTLDGTAMLGYAGMGMTAGGNEPSDWMSRVLRGWKLSLEQTLGVLAAGMSRRLPSHLRTLSAD